MCGTDQLAIVAAGVGEWDVFSWVVSIEPESYCVASKMSTDEGLLSLSVGCALDVIRHLISGPA
jgi:hypothetical protein